MQGQAHLSRSFVDSAGAVISVASYMTLGDFSFESGQRVYVFAQIKPAMWAAGCN